MPSQEVEEFLLLCRYARSSYNFFVLEVPAKTTKMVQEKMKIKIVTLKKIILIPETEQAKI